MDNRELGIGLIALGFLVLVLSLCLAKNQDKLERVEERVLILETRLEERDVWLSE